MIVAALSPSLITHICERLRPADRLEVMATRFDDRPEVLAAELIAGLPLSIFAIAFMADDGEPVAFVALWMLAPGVASINLLATDRWREIAPAVHRFVLRVVRDRVCAETLRRVECRTMATHQVSRGWLNRCGLQEEGILRALGRNGEDFVQFAWVNSRPLTHQEV